jgi:acetoin:2,6-dichlorophenolindophenol oxidoreductase subunit alpha
VNHSAKELPEVFERLTKPEKRRLAETMIRIRTFESRVEELFLNRRIPGFLHLSVGQEAVAAGVMATLRKDDWITSTHRGHGHVIAKGASTERMMAELFGKATGYCKGKGGSMHIADFSVGMLGANGVVGGGFNIAVGAGLSASIKKTDQVAVCFFGDGAANRGTFHEALNLAAIWKLPVVFVNENNQFASTTPASYALSVPSVADRARGYGIEGVRVDGNDAVEVYAAAARFVEAAREGRGPSLLECRTYRIKGHYVGDPEKYRTREEVQRHLEEDDPVERYCALLLDRKLLTPAELAALKKGAEEEIERAVAFAEASPYPAPEDALNDLFSFSPGTAPEVTP